MFIYISVMWPDLGTRKAYGPTKKGRNQHFIPADVVQPKPTLYRFDQGAVQVLLQLPAGLCNAAVQGRH